MAWVEGTETASLTIDAEFDDVVAFFCDPQQFKAAYELLESCEEIESEVWRWVLIEKREKGITYQADYTVEYTRDDNELTWITREGNMRSEGKTVVRQNSGGVQVDYTETLATDLPIPKLAAKVFRPIVAREIRHGVRGFLDRSKEILESG